jgi:hypothetical protein
MHTHIRETELKEEELKQHEETITKRDEELRIQEEQMEKCKKICYVISLHAVGSRLCVVILISICCNFNLFYVSYFNFLCNFFSNSLSTQRGLKW